MLTWHDKVNSYPSEHTNSVVVVDAEEVHEKKEEGDEQTAVAECVEKLGRDHER